MAQKEQEIANFVRLWNDLASNPYVQYQFNRETQEATAIMTKYNLTTEQQDAINKASEGTVEPLKKLLTDYSQHVVDAGMVFLQWPKKKP